MKNLKGILFSSAMVGMLLCGVIFEYAMLVTVYQVLMWLSILLCIFVFGGLAITLPLVREQFATDTKRLENLDKVQEALEKVTSNKWIQYTFIFAHLSAMTFAGLVLLPVAYVTSCVLSRTAVKKILSEIEIIQNMKKEK